MCVFQPRARIDIDLVPEHIPARSNAYQLACTLNTTQPLWLWLLSHERDACLCISVQRCCAGMRAIVALTVFLLGQMLLFS